MDAKKDLTSEVVAQFNITAKCTRHEDLIERHSCCPLCGTELKLAFQTNFFAQSVTEEAYCSSCNIQTRKGTFSLQ